MTRPPGTYWTFWQNPGPDSIGVESYAWSFLLKVNLPVILVLLAVFHLPAVREWTGCDPRLITAGFSIQFLYGVSLNLIGLERVHPRLREFGSNLVNLIAVTSIPLSSDKAVFALWALYPLVVWIDAYGSPKSGASLLTLAIVPWLDPLRHAGSSVFPDKLLHAVLAVSAGTVLYLVASYFTSWARATGQRKLEEDSRRAALAERERIGRSLHGTLGAALSEITLWHEVALAGGVRAAVPDDGDPLSRAHARAKAALTELRTLVAGLDDEGREALPAAGLSADIRRQIDGLCAAAGVRLEFAEPDGGALNMAAAYHVAKFAVEAVANAVRHGRPVAVRVELSLAPLRLEVADDGVGFDPATVTAGRGLRSLREHAEAVNAAFSLDAAPGRGTRAVLQGALA